MKVAFITRSTLYSVPGGDTEQIVQTARSLRSLGIDVDIFRTTEKIRYHQYDLLHAFNLTRPADILYHLQKADKPLILSTILVDYSEYDRYCRTGLQGFVLRLFPVHANEYVKAVARWLTGKDSLRSLSYLWKGQRRSMREILQKAVMLLPNSQAEQEEVTKTFGLEKAYTVVPNGIDSEIFHPSHTVPKNNRLVLSAARIEGRKNQLNLIRALNHSSFTLILTGLPAPNQQKYYEACRKEAGGNIHFAGRVPVDTLVNYYASAKVHVLPSWHETCGLSTLEAAAMGCNIVITERGFTREYFGNDAFYCEPGDPSSIFQAVERAAKSAPSSALQEKVLRHYTWQQAAETTLEAYKKAIAICEN